MQKSNRLCIVQFLFVLFLPLSVFLADATGIEHGSIMPTETQSLFTWVGILRGLGDVDVGVRGVFEVDVEAPAGKTITVTVPTAPATVYELEEDRPGGYSVYTINTIASVAGLDTHYPQGDYVLRLYADAGKQTLEDELVVTFGDGAGGALPFPEEFPVLTQPLPIGHEVSADTLQTYAWNAYTGAPGTATHMALKIDGTGEIDEDIADYLADIDGTSSYTPHLTGQAVPEGVFDLELSFYCLRESLSRGTQIEWANERYARHALTVNMGWDNGAADLGGDWYWLEWFGYFSNRFDPWLYHMEHGWLYSVEAAAPGAVLFYDLNMGWLYTSDALYPTMYSFTQQTWLWYQKGSKNPRWFVELATGVWQER